MTGYIPRQNAHSLELGPYPCLISEAKQISTWMGEIGTSVVCPQQMRQCREARMV
jgi:hypothetical protein